MSEFPVHVVPEGPDLPEALELRLYPRRVDGVPDSPGPLYELPLPATGVDLRLRAGRWLVSASYEITINARALGDSGSLWWTAAARVDGVRYEGDPTGVEVEISGPCTLTLELRRAST